VYFFGNYEHAIDERGRVAIPALYRHAFSTGGVVRAGVEGCVELYTHEGFEAEVQRRLEVEESTRTRSARRTRRGFLAGAFPVELDRQGRILVPQPIRAAGQLDGRAVIVGCGDYMEIWDRERWATERDAFEAEEAATMDEPVGAA
jgi:MraZ protein